MSRKPFTPKEDIAVGFIGIAGSIYVFVRAFTQMKDHWQQPMVLSVLFGLFSISMIYSGFNQLKREKAKKAAEEEPPVLDKQMMIDQVRKVLNIFRQKEEVRNIGVYKDYIYRYEQQLLALEQDLNYNCISGTGHIYMDSDAYGLNDPFIDEISKAEQMVHDYLRREKLRLKKPEEMRADLSAFSLKYPSQMEVIIDGSKISNYKDFIDVVQRELLFPGDCEGMTERYLDRIRDLSWLPYITYVFTIINSEELKRRNEALLKEIVRDFDEIIIPFWDHEFVHCIVGGERKDIHLNLIDRDENKMLTALESQIIDLLASELEKNHCPHSELIRKENIVSKESNPYYSFLFLPKTVEYSVGRPGNSYMDLEVLRDQGYPALVVLYEKDDTYTMIEIYMADSSVLPEDVTITGYKSYYKTN
ncbi:MAG: hypothetical protein IJK71_13345 [Clostridia bacterium]|nr:hypothetical protein [Clostridia bacterium]